MEAGRELDALVAEKVFGHLKPYQAYPNGTPCFSTSIAAAWEVVGKCELFKTYDFHQDRRNGKWQIGWGSDSAYFSAKFEGDTAPHVICLAALGIDPLMP